MTFDPTTTSLWRASGFDLAAAALPLIGASNGAPIAPDLDLWDCWPLQHPDGTTVGAGVREWWFFLSAPRFPDPGMRHDQARIRLLAREPGGWHDHGFALPDGTSPGAREWAGSAVLWEDGASVSLYFTAAGRAGEPSMEQRLFEARATLSADGIGDWQVPAEIVGADGDRYVMTRGRGGEPGMIKAFRDPAFFRDPATARDHILFTASAGWDADPFNGVVGHAVRDGGAWRLGDPLVEAVRFNNELERPHMHVAGGLYYLFFSTQRRTFADPAFAGPNGLYAMVADRFDGPWRPVNGSGLVAANPAAEPLQAYSWWVTGEGSVISFIDHWGLKSRSFDDHPEMLRGQFGGTPAPLFRIAYDGDTIRIV